MDVASGAASCGHELLLQRDIPLDKLPCEHNASEPLSPLTFWGSPEPIPNKNVVQPPRNCKKHGDDTNPTDSRFYNHFRFEGIGDAGSPLLAGSKSSISVQLKWFRWRIASNSSGHTRHNFHVAYWVPVLNRKRRRRILGTYP